MPHERRTETSLYGPVKRYLETLGYTVKGEVCGCDLVALRVDDVAPNGYAVDRAKVPASDSCAAA